MLPLFQDAWEGPAVERLQAPRVAVAVVAAVAAASTKDCVFQEEHFKAVFFFNRPLLRPRVVDFPRPMPPPHTKEVLQFQPITNVPRLPSLPGRSRLNPLWVLSNYTYCIQLIGLLYCIQLRTVLLTCWELFYFLKTCHRFPLIFISLYLILHGICWFSDTSNGLGGINLWILVIDQDSFSRSSLLICYLRKLRIRTLDNWTVVATKNAM